jgi:hypothetical protein
MGLEGQEQVDYLARADAEGNTGLIQMVGRPMALAAVVGVLRMAVRPELEVVAC